MKSGRIRFFDHDVQGAEVASKRAHASISATMRSNASAQIIKNHMRFHFFTSRLEGDKQEPSRKAIYRFFRDSGKAGIDLVLLGLADLRGTRGHTLDTGTLVNRAGRCAHPA